MSSEPPICVLHIGKTGGSFLRSIIRHNRPRWTRKLRFNSHEATRESTLSRFGPEREFAFVIRDPVERFVSAFYSRRREGRPTYNSDWSTREAVAFQWFEEAEDLARALDGTDQRLFSAARFAMRNIQHLARDHRFHLGDALGLLGERNQVAMCIELTDLTARLPEVMARLGIPDFEMPSDPNCHEDLTPRPDLSREAAAALRSYWSEEFEIYDVARSLVTEMWR